MEAVENINQENTPIAAQNNPAAANGNGTGNSPAENTPVANTPAENTQIVDPASLPPRPSKKRKANASGPKRTSPAWKNFTKVPESESIEPLAACNYCGKSIYLLDAAAASLTLITEFSYVAAHFKSAKLVLLCQFLQKAAMADGNLQQAVANIILLVPRLVAI